MKIAGSKILVTGGAGFVGSWVTQELVKAGANVRVYDNFSSGFLENLAPVKDDVEILRGDILDVECLEEAARGMDVLCHQAAQLEIIRCIEAPLEDLRSNTEGTLNVLDTAKKLAIGKVVYASSACVYGQAQYAPQDEATHPTVPNWPYGISKLAGEHYARIYNDYYGMKTVGLRYSIVYGPREWYGRVLTAFLKRATEGKSPVVWGGHQQRDFVYVEDVARFNRLCIEADTIDCEIFNVSTGIGTTIRELAAHVCTAFALPPPIFEDIKEGEVSQHVEGRMRLPAELKTMVLANEKAKQRTGWTPEVSLADGIQREMEWLRAHPDRWTTMHY